ncbi:hypothetical protein CACET_c15240 [Clostridium aceticum]|uniref:Uncharacterized protein n=1 Tax=Clostridium aceticum TaxID=84022 RepID=A0A0D8IC90_9CLOT|nr:hypothetical protein [Clostridium aceticum]AKL94973.1 hypothetical protein CACET_c15240 [Clostridium aceticum]KJF27883.1 hypothetical protein TZ02_04695 [Clostridium aceticum]
MGQENLKSFKLQKKEDFIVYLRKLIMSTYRHVKDYKRYIDELDSIIEERDLRNDKKKTIPRDLYTDIKHRITGVESHIMNIMGDLTNTALSYNKFRKLADKRQSNGHDLGLDLLEERQVSAPGTNL